MKWLIYFLLICNIGFAAWHFRGLNSQVESLSGISNISDESQLILLSEFKQQQKNLQAPEGAKLCYSLGPFTHKPESDNAQKLLTAESIDTQRLRLRDTSLSGYWVILPSSGSRDEALQHIQKLKKHKIEDFFLVATGSHQNAVSLGVYSQKNLARRRVDDMIRLGFIPRMESVALPRKVYWLNWYKDSVKQPSDAVMENIKKLYPQISKIERSCK